MHSLFFPSKTNAIYLRTGGPPNAIFYISPDRTLFRSEGKYWKGLAEIRERKKEREGGPRRVENRRDRKGKWVKVTAIDLFGETRLHAFELFLVIVITSIYIRFEGSFSLSSLSFHISNILLLFSWFVCITSTHSNHKDVHPVFMSEINWNWNWTFDFAVMRLKQDCLTCKCEMNRLKG